MTCVAITAHRRHTEEDARRARAAVRKLVENPKVDTIIFGGARGLDTVCLEAALQFRTDPQRPELIVLVPNVIADQPPEAQAAIRRADTVVELKNVITSADGFKSYKFRNARMVEISNVLVAFWNGEIKTGTGHAIGVARKLDRKVIIVKVTGRAS